MVDKKHTHTLVALCGTSPAVITETIWALAMESSEHPLDSNLPDRVVILTTEVGKQSIIKQLISPPDNKNSPSIWQQLKTKLAEHGYQTEGKLMFGNTSEHIRTFTTECPESGLSTPLDDLRNSHDQNAAADYMLETLRSITETPEEQLTVSIAGGRKTMSALLYGSMTLIGREDDRLTHVLVNDPFDSPTLTPRFYFPNQLDQKLSTDRTSQKEPHFVIASEATVELADIPFVPLRYAFDKHLSVAPPSFRSLVGTYTNSSLTQKNEPLITFELVDGSLNIGSIPLQLSPELYSLFSFFANRTKQNKKNFLDFQAAVEELNQWRLTLRTKQGNHPDLHWAKKLSPHNLTDIDIHKRMSELRQKIKKSAPCVSFISSRLPKKGHVFFNYPADKIKLNL